MTVEEMNELQKDLIIHSIIYYKFGGEVWPDSYWDEQALKLVSLKATDAFAKSKHYGLFLDFEGETGMQIMLPEYEAEAEALMNE